MMDKKENITAAVPEKPIQDQVKKPKKKPEAEILLDRQLGMKDKTRKTDIAILASFCAFILFFGVMFFVMKDKTYSETEKRALKQAPNMSFSRIVSDLKRDMKLMTMTEEERRIYTSEKNWENIKDKTGTKSSYSDYFAVFSDEIGDYYADQFPFRDQLRTVKAATEIVLLKQENNDVLFAGKYLVKKDTVTGIVQDESGKRDRTYEDAAETIKSNVNMIYGIEQFLPDNVDIRTAIAGRTVDVARSALPAIFPYADTHADFYWQTYRDAAEEKKISTVEIKDVLASHFDNGEYVYYKTDHHWTSLGAYYAYCEIIKAFGQTPYQLEDFNRETFSSTFVGTTYAKAGASFAGKDTIELFRFDGDEEYTTTITDSSGNVLTTLKAFYNKDVYRDINDKYSVFIGSDNSSDGGNNAVTIVKKNGGEQRQKLILIKDSFGNSLVPFLARHYDLVVLDMRVYTGDMTEFLSDPALAHILVAYNMETFMNDTNVSSATARIVSYYRALSQ